jgi:hypothetical protein
MKNRKIFFIECSESVKYCDKAQYDEASMFEKIKIHIHNFFCKLCRDYTSKNVKLTRTIKKANLKTCSEAEKKSWKKKINQEIAR